MFHLPNRVYFPQIDSMTADHLRSTLSSLYLYASLEFLSLMALHSVLVYQFRLPGLSQLAFVLERQWPGIQAKLIFWVFYNAQTPLQHYGRPCVHC
jgi:hypothetical protein